MFRCILRSPVSVLCTEAIGLCRDGDPGYCQDCIDVIAIDKNHFSSSYSTTAFPTDALHNANIDRFDGVWKMSGGCLVDSGYRLDGLVIMPNQMLKLQ